jgi:hypothetical protein
MGNLCNDHDSAAASSSATASPAPAPQPSASSAPCTCAFCDLAAQSPSFRLLLTEMDTLRDRNAALYVQLKQTMEGKMGQVLDAKAFEATFETTELKQAEFELEQVKRERLVSFRQDQRLYEPQEARVWEKAIKLERQRFVSMNFMMELWTPDTAEVEDGAEEKTQEEPKDRENGQEQ